MTLLSKIRNMGYAALLAITPAQMSCGELSSCTTDLDCKDKRVCEYNPDLEGMFCMTPEEAQEARNEERATELGSCSDNPFVNTYLWLLQQPSHGFGCDYGTVEPLQPDCTGILGEGYASSEQDYVNGYSVDRLEPFTYVGNVLHFPQFVNPIASAPGYEGHLRRANPFEYVYLIRNPSPGDIPSFEECFEDWNWEELEPYEEPYQRAYWEHEVNRLFCYLERDPSLYWGKTQDPCYFFFVWRNTTEPWINKNECREVERDKPWNTECNDLFPVPSPGDFQ